MTEEQREAKKRTDVARMYAEEAKWNAERASRTSPR